MGKMGSRHCYAAASVLSATSNILSGSGLVLHVCAYVYVHTCVFWMHTHVCAPVCGGQGPTTGIIPQELSTLCFSRTWGSPSSRDPPVSASPALGASILSQALVITVGSSCVASTLQTELYPQPGNSFFPFGIFLLPLYRHATSLPMPPVFFLHDPWELLSDLKPN